MAKSDKLALLAINGGMRLRADPFPERGLVGSDEKTAVDSVFDKAINTGISPGYNGEEEEAYCQEFSHYMGGGFTDAVNSGTTAIYVALNALKLEPFTEVIVGAITDPGGMMPIPLQNLIPMIADTAPGSFNTGPEQVEALISPRTSAILIPHIGGEPADIEGILQVANRHGLPLVEDCAQAHGASINGKMLGTFGTLAVFSTMVGKHHCSGGQGGLVFTQNEQLYQSVRRSSDRGKPYFMPQGATNTIASLNFNLNDLAAAIGRVQLRKLPEGILRRRIMTAKLAEGFEALQAISLPRTVPGAEPSYWYLRLCFHADRAVCDKETYCRSLIAEGLPIEPNYWAGLPHRMDWFINKRVFGSSAYPWSSPDYSGDPHQQFPCPNAVAAIEQHFNLRFHENWSARDIDDALAIFQRVEQAYTA